MSSTRNNRPSRSAKVATPQPNNQKMARPKQRRRKAGSRVRVGLASSMSQCALDYAEAICDPFTFRLKGRLPCIPDLFDLPSYKLSTIQRGTFAIGINNVGYIVAQPFVGVFDVNNISYTTAAFVGNAFAIEGTAGTLAIPNGQLPYNAANARDYRVVASGLRVRYIGTELNRGGIIIPASTPMNGDSLSALTTATTLARMDVRSWPCDRKWHGTTWRPAQIGQFTYAATSFPLTTAGNLDMGVMVFGTPGVEYEFEMVSFYEFVPVGALTVPSTTASHSDVAGMSRVRDFLNSVSSSEVGTGLWQQGIKYLTNHAVGGGSVLLANAASAAFRSNVNDYAFDTSGSVRIL